MKVALITGITGQDGSYLADLLLSKDYVVHGIVRHVANYDKQQRYQRIYPLLDRIYLHEASVENYASMVNIFNSIKPDECYHLAAQSDVKESFKDEFTTFNTNVNGTHNVLSIIHQFCPQCKFYFAASSEMFGNVNSNYQDENTPFNPVSPYGISKVAGFELTKFYRETFNMFACSGIMFNHESERRGEEFVTKRIARGAAAIRFGKQKSLVLGNIKAKRDWGYSPDYVRAMWLMLQHKQPDDYVIATTISHSVEEFAELAFSLVGLEYKDYIISNDSGLNRPRDISNLCGLFLKAKQKLYWEPLVNFELLVKIMVQYECGNQ